MIFILAQGQGSRWEHDTIPYKQLIPVSGTTLIERTLEMAGDGIPVCSSEFASHLSRQYPYVSLREPTQSILSGIVETLGCFDFDEDATFLLGDVVYSKHMMRLILNSPPGNASMYGRRGCNLYTGKEAGEIFAVKISKDFKRQFMTNCRKMEWTGKLWDYCKKYNAALFTSKLDGFEDWTDDIDSQDEYEIFGKKIIELAENEDECR